MHNALHLHLAMSWSADVLMLQSPQAFMAIVLAPVLAAQAWQSQYRAQ